MTRAPAFSRRLRRAALAVALAMAIPAVAQDASRLPDMGSSAAELLTPAQERLYGQQLLGELRSLGLLLEDPVLDGWLRTLGQNLAAVSERPRQHFTFFLLKDRAINAFASLGGHIGVNAGLVLTAEREDELAAVLAHEIAHVTQRHIVRAVESAQKDSLPIALAMLAAIIAAQQSGSSSGDATQAAIAGGIGLMQQRQINHTRASEHEADRIGIQTLHSSGYDPLAMADFFGRMQRALRSQGEGPPEFLRSHPVTTTRISEAKDRAEKLGARVEYAGGLTSTPANPAFPTDLFANLRARSGSGTGQFAFARERLRVLSATSPIDAVQEYRRRLAAEGGLEAAERYGLALAETAAGDAPAAAATLTRLADEHPDLFWIGLALAEAEHRQGLFAAAERRYQRLLSDLPGNRAVALSYARALAEQGTAEAGRRAQAALRPLLADNPIDAGLQHAFARASETAGDLVRATEAYAEYAYFSGRPEDALEQLRRLKQRQDLDYVQQARVDARIAALTPLVLERKARGERPEGRGGREIGHQALRRQRAVR